MLSTSCVFNKAHSGKQLLVRPWLYRIWQIYLTFHVSQHYNWYESKFRSKFQRHDEVALKSRDMWKDKTRHQNKTWIESNVLFSNKISSIPAVRIFLDRHLLATEENSTHCIVHTGGGVLFSSWCTFWHRGREILAHFDSVYFLQA